MALLSTLPWESIKIRKIFTIYELNEFETCCVQIMLPISTYYTVTPFQLQWYPLCIAPYVANKYNCMKMHIPWTLKVIQKLLQHLFSVFSCSKYFVGAGNGRRNQQTSNLLQFSTFSPWYVIYSWLWFKIHM